MHLKRIKGNVLSKDKYLSGVFSLFCYAVFQSQSRSLGPQNKSILDVLKVGWPCFFDYFWKSWNVSLLISSHFKNIWSSSCQDGTFRNGIFSMVSSNFYHFSAKFILFPEKEEILLFQLPLGVRDVLHLWDPSTNSTARMEWNFLMEWETHWSTYCSQFSTGQLATEQFNKYKNEINFERTVASNNKIKTVNPEIQALQ